MKRGFWGTVSLTLIGVFAIGAPAPAFAQTQAQQDRLNRVAQYVVLAKSCEHFGMKIDPELPTKLENAFKYETSSWQIEQTTLDRLMIEAISRQGEILKTDLDATVSAARTDAQLRAVRNTLLGYGRTCMAATNDPIFSPLIAFTAASTVL